MIEEAAADVSIGSAVSNAAHNRGIDVIFGSFGDTAMLGSISAGHTLSHGPLLGSLWFDNDNDDNGFIEAAGAGFHQNMGHQVIPEARSVCWL